MNYVKVYDTDTAREMAEKIYYHFEVNASCVVVGFLLDEGNNRMVPKGQQVMEFLEMFDEIDNIKYRGNKRERKFKYGENAVGGPIAHKIFCFDKKVVDQEMRYTIWRMQ